MKRLSEISGTLQFTSCICVMELRYGSRRREDHEVFWRRIQDVLLSRVEILDVGEETAILAGDLAVALSRKGFGMSAEDLLIAATTLQVDMTLITANTKHFEIVPGLKFENWIR